MSDAPIARRSLLSSVKLMGGPKVQDKAKVVSGRRFHPVVLGDVSESRGIGLLVMKIKIKTQLACGDRQR